MHPTRRVTGISIFTGALLFAGLAMLSRPANGPVTINLRAIMQAALADPVDFARSRITGGIGVMLETDPATGIPMVGGIGAGSPAAGAGLLLGDLVTKVDGLTATNLTLAQLAGAIGGLARSKVTLGVQRGGTTNFECVIQRSSWKALRELSYSRSAYE